MLSLLSMTKALFEISQHFDKRLIKNLFNNIKASQNFTVLKLSVRSWKNTTPKFRHS